MLVRRRKVRLEIEHTEVVIHATGLSASQPEIRLPGLPAKQQVEDEKARDSREEGAR